MFKELGMSSTFAERREMIIPHRARYYLKNNDQISENWQNVTEVKLLNAPIIDDLESFEHQLPSGGLLSTVPDLLKFGNYMLNSYKGVIDTKSGYLKSSTIQKLWSPISPQIEKEKAMIDATHYGEGWFVTDLIHPISCSGDCKSFKKVIWHTGGITGQTNILAIFPEQEFVIAILTNSGANPKLGDYIFDIAMNFA